MAPSLSMCSMGMLSVSTVYYWVHGFFCLFFWLHHMACRILVPQPGTEPGLSTVKSQGPNHWTAGELPIVFTAKPVSESKCGRWGVGKKRCDPAVSSIVQK